MVQLTDGVLTGPDSSMEPTKRTLGLRTYVIGIHAAVVVASGQTLHTDLRHGCRGQ